MYFLLIDKIGSHVAFLCCAQYYRSKVFWRAQFLIDIASLQVSNHISNALDIVENPASL